MSRLALLPDATGADSWYTLRDTKPGVYLDCAACRVRLGTGDRITTRGGLPVCEVCVLWDAAPPAPPPLAVAPPAPGTADDRDPAIRLIRQYLKARSGKDWSVKGNRGTAWGWIDISAPPRRLARFGYMTAADRVELGKLLGMDRPVHPQGQSIAAAHDYRREYVARAAGRTPTTFGSPYWD